jgi:hypothetical protein
VTPGTLARRAWPWLLVAAGVAAVVALTGSGGRSAPPLDPGSGAPDGTAGLVEVLRDLGAEVTVTDQPGPGAGTALLLADNLPDDRRAALLDWVRAGGTLVVADPRSTVTEVEITAQAGSGPFSVPITGLDCDVPALRGIDRITAPGSVVFDVPPGATGCYRYDEGAWLLVQPTGSGTVVRLGGAAALTNTNLRADDNGLLGPALLAPADGTQVTILRPPGPGGGRRTLSQLVPPRVTAALWQLGLAFAVFAWWRGRRLGRPVADPVPVEIPASELVVAVGNLLQRSGLRERAAGSIADELRGVLGERLGLPPSTPPDQLAAIAADRTGVDPARILAVLAAPPPATEAELVALAQTAEQVRREVTSGAARPVPAATLPAPTRED